MLSPNDYIQKAIEHVELANSAKLRGNLPEALRLLNIGLGYFNNILKNKQHTQLKETITPYVTTYLAEAEELKQCIATSSSSPMMTSGSNESTDLCTQSYANNNSTERSDDTSQRLQQIGQTKVKTDYGIRWEEVIGLEGIKTMLREIIELPRDMPHLFTGNRKVIRSILLYGPPGTGKTFLAKALASNSGYAFYSVSSAELISKYVGDSEKNIRSLFDTLRADTPCILFLDEVEALCASRDEQQHTKTVQQFLVQFDGLTGSDHSNEGIFILACTNTPWALDTAMRRRLERKLYVPLPTEEDRARLFAHYIGKNDHALSENDFITLAQLTPSFSSADIKLLTEAACMQPWQTIRDASHFVRHNDRWFPCDSTIQDARPLTYQAITNKSEIVIPKITSRHVRDTLSQIKATVQEHELTNYDEWTIQYGSNA
jgi:vacuolar protein-sorting-associated protein 4